MFLAIHDTGAPLAALVGDEGTAEEQAFVAELRAEGLMHEPADVADADADAGLGPVLAAREGAATATDLVLLEWVAVSELVETHERLAHLRRCDRVAARVAALRAEAVVSLAGQESSGQYLTEVHLEHELAVAARTSHYAAGRAVENARALATTFPAFATALHQGEICAGHVAVLVERTRCVTDAAALADIERVGVRKARRMTVGEFAREVVALVARFDPDAGTRVSRARDSRNVSVRQLDDGLGFLGLVHDWSTVKAIHQQVTADAKVMQAQRRAEQAAAEAVDDAAVSGALADDATDLAADAARAAAEEVALLPDDDARLDACRADALTARLLGAPAARVERDVHGQRGFSVVDDDPGTVVWERSAAASVEVRLVIDLATLRREADHPCLLDGAPIPAALGRELASYAKVWRRMVTDPVDGHLLDYGTRTYLPQPLRSYVAARDGGCCAPGCTTSADSRLQMDHAVPFPAGGSDPANNRMLCTTCHQLKTAGLVDVVDPGDDGSATWLTGWGQTVWIPPRSYLPDVEPPSPPPEPVPF
jgi:hypothetical protein